MSTTPAALTAESFPQFHKALLSSVVKATKATSCFHAEDTAIVKTENAQFASDLEACSKDLLALGNTLLSFAADGASVKRYHGVHDLVGRWGPAVDVIDNLLEQADVCLDRAQGKAGAKKSATAPANIPSAVIIKAGVSGKRIYHAATVNRPQEKFKNEIDNSLSTPFVPRIKDKPHAKRPLDLGLSSVDLHSLPADHVLPHPYEYEIKTIEYPAAMFTRSEPIPPTPWETTTHRFIATAQELDELISTLRTVSEIAVDLEHHSYRTYQGFLCLMQISTRTQDYIIDVLELRPHMSRLNEVFADPTIIKVFHGADHDVLWLQQDFGLYLVNLFDTFHASKVLNFGKHSLAALLKMYCDFDADKKYQTADWRIRPLPKEFLEYARSDTHFLLFIYDNMRNALIDQESKTFNAVKATLHRSAETALKRYYKNGYDAEKGTGSNGWLDLFGRHNKVMTKLQFAVFKAIHQWRDEVAREEDESTAYVLPNHMLFSIAERLPTDQASVLACCTPIPPLVRVHSTDIVHTIRKLKESLTAAQVASAIEVVGGVEPKAPTHITFKEEIITSAPDSEYHPYVPKHTPVTIVVVHRSTLLGNEETKVSTSVLNQNKVKQIRSSTVSLLEALLPKAVPMSKEQAVLDAVPKEPHEPPAHHAFVPRNGSSAAAVDENAPFVISDLKRKSHGGAQPQRQTLTVSDSDSDDDVQIVGEKPAKHPRRDIEPFDYSQASADMADIAGDTGAAQGQPQPKSKNKRAATWKPYNMKGQGNEQFGKKEQRLPTAPRSGNKSSTFQVSK
ncbi:exosome nuclease subunit [Sorochytrium milnesiophthora]